MKKIYLYISIIFVLNLSIVLFLTLQAKWHHLDSPTSDSGFSNAHFLNSSIGYIVGNRYYSNRNPVILKTTDGETFEKQNINSANKVFDVYPFKQTIMDVYPIDEHIAYVCGNFGLVAKTIDGGKNWIVQDFPNEEHLTSMYFFDKNIGYLAGGGGTLAKTIDGGINWTLLESGMTRRLWDIEFVSPDIGFICGGLPDSVKILRTIDGGNSWKDLPIDKIASGSIYDLDFINTKTGVAVTTAGQIIKTTDGGDNWFLLKSTSKFLRSVDFTSDLSGSVCGNDGLILNTNDGGKTWVRQKSPSLDAKSTIQFVQNIEKGFTEAYVVGMNGSIMKYKKPLQIEDPNLLAALLENFNPSLFKYSFVLNPIFMLK